MKLRVGSRTDIGQVRARNEDSYLVRDPLYVVADGMGGHRGGNVASSMAIEGLEPPAEGAGPEAFQLLVGQIQDANRRVLERGDAERELRGMGTTLTAILATGDKAYVAHVGDSRAYMLRDGSLQQLTEDHTLVQRMIRDGRLTEEEARAHPQRSVLTRVLGVQENMAVDELTLELKPGDRILLCTDGLSSMIDRQTIQQILEEERDPQAACDRLVEEANRAGGDDNITAILVDVAEDGEKRAAEPSEPPEPPEPPAAPAAPAEPISDPPRPAKGSPGRTIRWGRLTLWVGVVVVVLAAAMTGSRLYIDRQWYVGDSGGRVAIYNGIPATVLGFKLSHVQETTELSSADAERLVVWHGLNDGITADSFSQALAIVDRIRQDIQDETATPGGGG